jgi:hypothetical protein
MPGINTILTRTTENSSKILYDFVEKYEHFDNNYWKFLFSVIFYF